MEAERKALEERNFRGVVIISLVSAFRSHVKQTGVVVTPKAEKVIEDLLKEASSADVEEARRYGLLV